MSPLRLDYGNVAIGSKSNMTVTVRNDGTAALVLGTVTLAGFNPDQFVVVAGANLCAGRTLAAGQSCTVLVRFKPNAPGAMNAKLRIPSNDPDEAVVKVTLGGTASAASRLPRSPSPRRHCPSGPSPSGSRASRS